MMRQENARILPFYELKPLVRRNPHAELAWLSHEFLDDLPPEAGGPKFLGFDEDRNPHFAVDISAVEDPSQIAALAPGTTFEDGRSAAADIPGDQTGILAQARSNLNWHSRHRYCSACGTESQSQRGGLMRQCPNCDAQHFPRTDPVAIMLVYRGDRCVMGQTVARSTTIFYSCLAGFMDQGESIEAGVRRAGPNGGEGLRACPGHEEAVRLNEKRLGDAGDLFGRLALGEDHLGEALADRPVVVYLGEAQVLVGQAPQLGQEIVFAEPGVLEISEQGPQASLVDGSPP